MGIVRNTKSVKQILDLFEKRDDAISAVELVKNLKGSMNKTTVYRILDRLEEEGIVHTLNDVNGLKRYAKCHDCSAGHHADTHPHFQCTTCGKTECLDMEVTIPEIPNREVSISQILIQGKCEQCLV